MSRSWSDLPTPLTPADRREIRRDVILLLALMISGWALLWMVAG